MDAAEVAPGTEALARVIPLFRERSCYVCKHHRFTDESYSFCEEFNELLIDEKGTAADCESYSDDPAKE